MITTVNLYTQQPLEKYREETLRDVKKKIAELKQAQQKWKLDADARRLTRTSWMIFPRFKNSPR